MDFLAFKEKEQNAAGGKKANVGIDVSQPDNGKLL
jgi:hypothetical protein